VTVSGVKRHDAETEAAFRWYDEIRLPDLLQCRGAAGAWTFASDDLFAAPWPDEAPPAWSFADRNSRKPEALPLRLTVIYLDEDPLEFLADVAAREPGWKSAGRLLDTSPVEDVVFASPFRMIVPWEWTWFDTDKETIGSFSRVSVRPQRCSSARSSSISDAHRALRLRSRRDQPRSGGRRAQSARQVRR
jgi:hypothetical protein